MEEVKKAIITNINMLLNELNLIVNNIKDFPEYKKGYLRTLGVNIDKQKSKSVRFNKKHIKDFNNLLKKANNKVVTMIIIKYNIKYMLENNVKTNLKRNEFTKTLLNMLRINDVDEFYDEFFKLINYVFFEWELNEYTAVLKTFSFNLICNIVLNFESNFFCIFGQHIRNIVEVYTQIQEKIANDEFIGKDIIRKINLQSYYIKICSSDLLKSLLNSIEIYNEEIRSKFNIETQNDTKKVLKENNNQTPYQFNLEVNHPSRQERKNGHEKLYTDAEPETLEGKALEQLNEIYSFLCEALGNKEDYKIIVADLQSLFECVDPSNIDVIIGNLVYMLNNNQDLNEERKITLVKRLGQIKK